MEEVHLGNRVGDKDRFRVPETGCRITRLERERKYLKKLGAGEILLSCIDKDGTNSGFDLELINHVKSFVTIPVIASSGAGSAEHFRDVFMETGAEAALAAGELAIFAGPINDNDGNERIAEGESGGMELLDTTDWLVEGVIGQTE